MTQRIQAPDGSIVEFPDGMSDDQIARAMQLNFGGPKPQAPTGLDHAIKDNLAVANPQTPLDAFNMGLGMSASGLAINAATGMKTQPKILPEHAPFLQRLLNIAGQQLGDLPFNGAGALMGAAAGGLVTSETGPGAAVGAMVGGGAGAAALPEALRQSVIVNYNRKRITTAQDVLDRAWQIGVATTKAATIGAVMGPVGAKAGAAVKTLTGSASAGVIADLTAQAATATTVGSAMDGHIPDADDFLVGSLLALGVHGAMSAGGRIVPTRQQAQVAQNMQKLYVKTGIPPWELAARSRTDPELRQEILQQDADGDPVAPKITAGKPAEPPPVKPLAPQSQPGQSVSSVVATPDALKMIAYAENTSAYAKLHKMSENDVVSYAGAIGKYQITPDTARTYMGPDFDVKTLRDPAVNEKVAGTIIGHLEKTYKLSDGSPDNEAIAIAYHSGPGKANEFLRKGRDYSVLGPKAQRYLERLSDGGFLKPPEPSAEELATGGGGKPPGEPPEPPKNFEDATPEELGQTIMAGVSKPDEPGFLSKFKGAIDKAYDDYVNMRGEAHRLDRENGSEPVLEDAFQSLNASRSRADYFMTKGSIADPHTFAEGDAPAYLDAYKQAAKNGGSRDGFLQYRLAKQAIADHERGLESPIDAGAARAYVDKTQRLYEEPDRMVNRSKNAALDYAQKAGLYTSEQVQRFKEQNPSHIVQRRDLGDTDVVTGGARRSAVKPTQVKAKQGSKRLILDPQHADIENLASLIAAADKNVALRTLIEGKGDNVLGALGLRKIGEETLGAGAVQEKAGGPRTKNDFDVYFGGKKHTYTIVDNPELAKMIHGASPVEMGMIGRVAQTFAGAKRSGVTDTIDFLSRAVFRDQITASILNKHGGIPFQHLVAGAYHMVRMDEVAQEYARAGGYGASLAEMDANYFQRHIDKMFSETGVWDSVVNAAATPLHTMQIIATRIDALTRLGRYAQQRGLGMEPLGAAMDSRRFTLDFSTRGASQGLTKLAQMTTFLRPTILGHDQLIRAFAERPVTTTLKTGLYVTLPSVLMYMWNREADKNLPEEEQYLNQPRWLRDLFWITPPIGGVRFPFPKPFVIGQVAGSLVERMLEWHETNDPNSYKDLVDNLIGAVTLPLLPAMFAPVAEQAWNFNGLNGKPLIPASVAEASGYMQYTPNTSETAVQLARVLGPMSLNAVNVSPIVIQNYVREWAGSLGMQALHVMDVAFEPTNTVHELKDNPFIGGFVTRHTDMGLAPIQDFYDNVAKVKAANKDLKLAMERQDMAELATASANPYAAVRITQAEQAMGKMSAAIRAVRYDKDMNVDEKRQYIEGIYQQMLGAAKEGNDALKELAGGR